MRMMNATTDARASSTLPMAISGTTQYAIRAVVHVAEHAIDAPVRVDAIATALGVPRNYLSKTLHLLVRAGVLHSGRGPRGGFQLARPAAELTLAQVAAPFDDLDSRQCLLGRPTCGWRSPCAAHSRWEAISTAMHDFFGQTTIADLMDEIAERPASAPAHDRKTPAPRRPRSPRGVP